MKGNLGFDPRHCGCGPATEAVHRILLDWEDIDWFTPGSGDRDEAAQLFLQHNRLGRAFAPELFASYVEVECRGGDWAEFVAWCTRTRSRQGRWDWKFSALKPLSVAHAAARCWSLDSLAADHDGGKPFAEDLFVRHRGTRGAFVAWRGAMPKIAELEPLRNEPAGDAAEFYLRHAHDDVIRCIQWQLAERGNDLGGNPFLPLLRCYRAGFYPFVLNRESALLFRFTTTKLRSALRPAATGAGTSGS
jgi:hypothetical protein